MKTIRKDWPKVRQYVKGGHRYFQVDLRRKHYKGQKWKNFTGRDEALDYAAEVGAKVAKSEIYSLESSQGDDRLKAWGEQCAIYGKTVEQAIETAVAVWKSTGNSKNRRSYPRDGSERMTARRATSTLHRSPA